MSFSDKTVIITGAAAGIGKAAALEFAELICFLASDKAVFISGQDYVTDGCRKKL